MTRPPLISTLFPYTTLFRSDHISSGTCSAGVVGSQGHHRGRRDIWEPCYFPHFSQYAFQTHEDVGGRVHNIANGKRRRTAKFSPVGSSREDLGDGGESIGQR